MWILAAILAAIVGVETGRGFSLNIGNIDRCSRCFLFCLLFTFRVALFLMIFHRFEAQG